MEQTTKLFQVKEKLEPQGFLSDAEFAAPAGSRILSVTAMPRLSQSECQSGEIRLTGLVEYKVVYIGNDGQIDCGSVSKDFYERIMVKGVTPNTEVYLKARAEDVEFGDAIPVRIRATVEICGFYLKTVSLPEVRVENAEMLTEAVQVNTVKILRDTVAEISKEVDFPGGIDKVLTAEASININSVTMATEVAYIEGECIVSVVYLVNGSVQETKVSSDFNTEVLSPGLTDETSVHAEGVVLSANAVTVDQKTALVEVTALIKATSAIIQTATVLKDVFSLTDILEVNGCDEHYKKCVCKETVSERVEASKRLSADSEKIRAILAASIPCVQGLTVTAEERGFGDDRYVMIAEGVLVAKAIYLSESGSFYPVVIEAPFQFASRETICPGATTFTADKVRVTGYAVKQRLPDEIELTATVTVEATGYQEICVTMLSTVECKEPLPEDNTAIVLYITDPGESLWNVCKTLRITEASLLCQNPELTLPLVGGEKIISYREL